MIIDRIEIEEVFPIASFANLKLKAAGSLEEGEDIIEAYKQARQKLQAAFHAINGETEKGGGNESAIEIPVIDHGKQTMIDIIGDCTTTEELEKHIRNVDKYDLWSEYNAKFEEIKDKS